MPVTASPGGDYDQIDTTVAFPAAATVENVPITIHGNGPYQGARTFSVNIGTITGSVAVGRATATATINSHNPAPVVAVGSAAVNENQSSVPLPVTLSTASAIDTTVQYATLNGTALAGRDYTATTGILTIPAGQTTGTVTVPILNHNLVSPQATFHLALFNPQGATVGADVATGTILGSGLSACRVATISWTGGAGDAKWSTAGNWQPLRVPSATDNVCVSTGSGVTVDQAAAVSSLEADTPLTIDAHLQLTNTLQNSKFAANTLLSGPTGAGLDVAGTLDVTTGTLTWGQRAPVASMGWVSTFGGSGTVIVHAGASFVVEGGMCAARFSRDAFEYLGGCVQFTPALRNDGTVTVATGQLLRDSAQPWTNTGTLNLNDDPSDSNHDVARISGGCAALPEWPVAPCNPFPLTNSGLISRAAGPTPSNFWGVLLANQSSGTVNLAGGITVTNQAWNGQLAGSWIVGSGSTLQFSGTGALTEPLGASITGAGTVQVYNPGQSLDLAGTFTVANVAVDAGTLTVENPLSLASLEMSGGTIQGPGSVTMAAVTPPAAVSTITMNGGTLAVAGSVIVSNTALFNWERGTVTGPGTITVAGGATMNLTLQPHATDSTLSAPLVNNGVINMLSGILYGGPGGSISNHGTLTLGAGAGLLDQASGAFTFTNIGLVSGNAGAGNAAQIAGYTGQNGAVHVLSGVLTLQPPLGITANLLAGASVASGATLELEAPSSSGSGGFKLPTGATLSGAGTLSLNTALGPIGPQGPLAVELAGADNLPALTDGRVGGGWPATLNVGTNSINVTTYYQAANSSLISTLAANGNYGAITATGTATVAGNLTLGLLGTYQPPIGTAFKIVKATSGLSGTYNTITNPPGETYTPTYTPTTATLIRAS